MNKYKKLIKNTGIYAISSFGSKILTFLILPLYSYVLSTAEYGVVDIYLTTLNLLLPIVSLSIFDAVFRYVIDASSNDIKLQYFETGITFSLISSAVLVGITAVIPFFANISVSNVWLFCVVVITQLFISCMQQFSRAIDKISIFAISSGTYTLSYLVCNVIFLVFLKSGVTGYLCSYVVAGLLTLTYLIVSLIPHIKLLGIFHLSLKHLRVMLTYCVPLIPNAVLLWIMNAINRWFIIYFCGVDSNGLYAFASKIPTILSLFTSIFFQAWQISAIDELKEKDSSFSKQVYSTLSIVCYFGVTFLLAFVGPLMRLVTNESYWAATEYIPLLLLGVVFQTYSSFYGTIYIAYKKTWNVLITSAIGAAVSIIGNFVLIPIYGVQGACFTTMISYLCMWFIRVLDTKKLYLIKTNALYITISVVLMLLQATMCLLCKQTVYNTIFIVAMLVLTCTLERRTITSIINKRPKKR